MEQAFGVLKSRFRILKGVELRTLKEVPNVILACMVLHNICIDQHDTWAQVEATAQPTYDEDTHRHTAGHVPRANGVGRDAHSGAHTREPPEFTAPARSIPPEARRPPPPDNTESLTKQHKKGAIAQRNSLRAHVQCEPKCKLFGGRKHQVPHAA